MKLVLRHWYFKVLKMIYSRTPASVQFFYHQRINQLRIAGAKRRIRNFRRRLPTSTNTERLSLVLLNWKRTELLERIIQEYSHYRCIDEILVWNNNRDLYLAFPDFPKVKVINSSQDYGLDTRFALGAIATHDKILFHDDDLFLPEESIVELLRRFLLESDLIHSLHGRNLVKDEYSIENSFGPVDIVLTRCQIVSRTYMEKYFQTVGLFSDLRRYGCGNGEDIILNYVVRATTGKKKPGASNSTHRFKPFSSGNLFE